MILSNNNYHWFKNKATSFVKMCFCRTSHGDWSFDVFVQHIDESCPRLSTQVVFTAALLKILRTSLSCLVFLSLVRVSANCCGVLSALESSLKERALSIKGRQQRSLSLFSALSCIESIRIEKLSLSISFTVSRWLAWGVRAERNV